MSVEKWTLAAALVVAGCAQSAVPSRPAYSGERPSLRAGETYRVIHVFGHAKDGFSPQAALLDVKGTLYGTTSAGGSFKGSDCAYTSCGTVFSINASGAESIVHSFGQGSDGATPLASLISVNGTLFGTTQGGGSHCTPTVGCGTLFSINPTGTETVVHDFGASGDGSMPDGPLVDVNGTLYGTTVTGGAYVHNGGGTVFSIGPSASSYRLLHSFGKGNDGAQPRSGLFYADGTFYGTTYTGGGVKCYGYPPGCGTIFAISTSGTERVIHRFNFDDGSLPSSALIEVNGRLFGTTSSGGTYGGGVAFSVSPTGTNYRVLHSFGGFLDGTVPVAGLVESRGMLYGTTAAGGGSYSQSNISGTIFEIHLNGSNYKQLYVFETKDGDAPAASLILGKGGFYGTTSQGGKYKGGTAFAFTP